MIFLNFLSRNLSGPISMLIFLISLACHGESHKNTNSKDSAAVSTPGCLSSDDSLEVVSFLHLLDSLITDNDTERIISHINFPIVIEGENIDSVMFVISYFSTFTKYLLKNHIPEDEISSLERSEYFLNKRDSPGCWKYLIYNKFPELEFNVNFIIEKINGEIKVISLRIIG